MKIEYDMYYFDGTMDFMENYEAIPSGASIFIARYWYYMLHPHDFCDFYNMSKKELEERMTKAPTLPNGWKRLTFMSLIGAAPSFYLRTPDGRDVTLQCLTSK